VYQWCGFKSRRGKNKNLTALKSNSNTVWFNFQTYIYICMNTSEKTPLCIDVDYCKCFTNDFLIVWNMTSLLRHSWLNLYELWCLVADGDYMDNSRTMYQITYWINIISVYAHLWWHSCITFDHLNLLSCVGCYSTLSK
jgi:hypothetical protein